MKKQKPIDAPTNGTVVLARCKNPPTVSPAIWNGVEKEWVVATPRTGFFKNEWIDTYFENDYFSHEDLI